MILAIRRAERFSPNCVDKDTAILQGVCTLLVRDGYDVRMVDEESAWPNGEVNVYLTMGRTKLTVERLLQEERNGAVVVNTPKSVALCCNRRRVNDVLAKGGVPVPAEDGYFGYWLKRGDGTAQTACDVRFAADKAEMLKVKAEMTAAGVTDIVVQAHVVGDLVKFYGVRGTQFFRTFYPGDDGQSKFGDEQRNGSPCHYLFSIEGLHNAAERAALLTGVEVYGGDCIISPDGSFSIIDFNDWPSFSRCREEAAEAIASVVREATGKGQK